MLYLLESWKKCNPIYPNDPSTIRVAIICFFSLLILLMCFYRCLYKSTLNITLYMFLYSTIQTYCCDMLICLPPAGVWESGDMWVILILAIDPAEFFSSATDIIVLIFLSPLISFLYLLSRPHIKKERKSY